jgi:hypothetical protein
MPSVDDILPIYVLTYPTHHWLLPGFAFLFNKFWSEPGKRVHIVTIGETLPELPGNFKHIQIREKQWTDGLLSFLEYCRHDFFILLLEDFWMTAPAEVAAIKTIYTCMTTYPNDFSDVLRIDLSGNRAKVKKSTGYAPIHDIEMIQTIAPSPYQMSTQAAIWNKDLLRSNTFPNETAWDFEEVGTKRLNEKPEIKVLGTRLPLIHYKAIWLGRSHKFYNLSQVPYLEYMRKMRWLEVPK